MTANPYYPVTTVSDTSQLADDDWGLNLPGVQYSGKHPRSSRLKSMVSSVQNLPRCAVVIFVSVTVLILVCVCVALAASGGSDGRRPTGGEPARVQTKMGLNFYPIPKDGTIVIRYRAEKLTNDDPIKKSMDDILRPYAHSPQADTDKYVHCDKNPHPDNQTCSLPLIKFGHECTESNDYGYHDGFPCVLLQLNLPPDLDLTIKPITEDTPLWSQAKEIHAVEQYAGDPSAIPVTCQGQTKMDDDLFNSGSVVSSDGKRLRYSPSDSLPAYFYPRPDPDQPGDLAEFIKPAVMLQFTSLRDNHMVHMRCTAWGQLFKTHGEMIQHDLLDVNFAIYAEA